MKWTNDLLTHTKFIIFPPPAVGLLQAAQYFHMPRSNFSVRGIQ